MTDIQNLKVLAEHCRDQVIRSHGWAGMIEDADLLGSDEKFLLECSPEAILALIAENERLSLTLGDRPAYRTAEYESKRDAMWRRAHMVATSKGYDHINLAIAAAPNACKGCDGCGGEWQGEGLPNSICATCKGSLGKTLAAELESANARLHEVSVACATAEQERDALKAQVKMLQSDANSWQSGYDEGRTMGTKTAYSDREQLKAEISRSTEREIMQLAEIEGLRATVDLKNLLPELDEALEELEIHGQHRDQGYRKLKDWYRKVALACKAIDTANRRVEPDLDTTDELAELREELRGVKSVGAMHAKALKRLTFMARTSGGTAGPDAELMKACDEAEQALTLGGVGRAYMLGADAAMSKGVAHD